MIRRDVPRGAEDPSHRPSHWLLISQIEHARISHQLAAAWQNPLPQATDATREEFLAAVLHHDDGWDDWQTAPKIDPEHGRPYGFTEMPPPLAQQIWSDSIDACRAIGPLAAWVAASHFIWLQNKQDDDFHEWSAWLAEQEQRRIGWLAEWRLLDPTSNTKQLADRCLTLLQAFDWLSLWLCCRGPIDPRDPAETLDLGGVDKNFGPYTFTPNGREIEVTPWPFAEPQIDILAEATWAEPGVYQSASEMLSKPTRAAWRLTPANATAIKQG